MATLTLEAAGTAIGTAIGGPIGGFIGGWIGSTVGAYVDNLIISSFNPMDGPRLGDLKVTTSTYGLMIPLLYGPAMPTAGLIIWSSDLLEESTTGKGGPVTETYTYSVHLAVLLADGERRRYERVLRIKANGKVIYDEAAPGPALPATDTDLGYTVDRTYDRFDHMDRLSFYPGSFLQMPDPIIQAFEGVDDTQAYRGSCYVFIENLQLAEWGNRIPNFEFLVQCRDGETVATIAADVVEACGLNPDMVGAASVTEEVIGYAITRPSNGIGCLQPLGLAYNFDLAEVWGSLRLQTRGGAPAALIPLDDIGAHEYGTQRPEPIRWPMSPEVKMPERAVVTYRDPDRDYQENSQEEIRAGGSAQNRIAVELPIVISNERGREIVGRMLWEAWHGQLNMDLSVSDRWLSLEPARPYLFETPLGLERGVLRRRQRGANRVSRLEMRRDAGIVYQSDVAPATAPTPPNELSLAGPTVLQLLDIPIIEDADDNTGFYFAVAGEQSGWRGADLWRSTGGDYAHQAKQGVETIMGTVDGNVDPGPSHVWDRATVIRIELDDTSDELESMDELEVLNGNNYLWIGPASGLGGEVIGFATATLVSPGVYDVSDLLRGRLGTEHEISAHGANERVVRITYAGLERLDYGAGDWNKDRDYKAVSVFQLITDAVAETFSNTGEGKRPWAPVLPTITRDGSNNLTMEFFRRSRLRAPGLGNGSLPLGEAVELYETDIFDGADVVATYEHSTPVFEYSAADQTADGLTPGDPVVGITYQISDVRGRGHGMEWEG